MAIEWNPSRTRCTAVIHGRDSIDTLFPKLYTRKTTRTRQAEEFHKITDGGDYGWPCTFFDTKLGKRVLAPGVRRRWRRRRPEAGKYPDPLVWRLRALGT